MATEKELEQWLAGLTDEELRHLGEHGEELMEPIVSQLSTALSGTFACRCCGGSGKWSRIGKNWTADCDCGFNAAGMISSLPVTA